MKRAWITGLTLAGVAGTGGAAFAGMSITGHDGSAVEAQGVTPQAGTLAPSSITTYQLGTAGTVTISVGDGTISVMSTVPATGWSVLGTSGPATHVEVRLTDTVQVLTFTADLVDGKAVVSLTNAGVDPVTTPDPAAANGNAPAPQPATPAPAPAPRPARPVVVLTPPTLRPSPAATTAASGSPTVGANTGSGEHESEGSDD